MGVLIRVLESQFFVSYLSSSRLSVNHFSAFSTNFEDLRFRYLLKKQLISLLAVKNLPSFQIRWETGLTQWWQRSPPTNVIRFRFQPAAISGSIFLVLAKNLLSLAFTACSSFQNQSPNLNSIRTEEPYENQLRLAWLSLYILEFGNSS